jgi:hypothetical protein
VTGPEQPQPEQAEAIDPERLGCSESTMLIVRERQLTAAMREAGVFQGAALEARALAADLQGRLQKASEEWGVASAAWLAAQGEYESEIARLNARVNELLDAAEQDAGQVVDGVVVEPVEPVAVEPADKPADKPQRRRPA